MDFDDAAAAHSNWNLSCDRNHFALRLLLRRDAPALKCCHQRVPIRQHMGFDFGRMLPRSRGVWIRTDLCKVRAHGIPGLCRGRRSGG